MIKVQCGMWENHQIHKQNVESKRVLPQRKFCNGVYTPQYELVMFSGRVYYVDCRVFDKGV